MTVFWIDVSHHDWSRRGGNLDWAKVRAQTSPVMCARATYGDPAGWNRVSHHFGDFQRSAADAGFDVRGGYHNLIRGDAASMRRQVEWLRRELDAHDCQWAMSDIERYKELVTANMWPRWQDVLRWRDAWAAADDRSMAWYLPQWVYHSSGFLGGDLRELPGLFIQSHYAGGDGTLTQIYANAGGDTGTGWDDCFGKRCPDGWQFTAVANVDGASDQTDVNAFRGTVDQLCALINPNAGQHGKGTDMLLIKIEEPERTVYVSDGHRYRPLGPANAEAALNAAISAGHRLVTVPDLDALEAIAGRPVGEPVPAPPVDAAALAAALALLLPTGEDVAAAVLSRKAELAKAVTDEIAS